MANSYSLKQPLLRDPQNSSDIELRDFATPEDFSAPVHPSPTSALPQLPQQAPANPQSVPGTKTIACAGCPLKLAYPDGAYCVKCPQCSTLTAVIPVIRIQCWKCQTPMVAPAHAGQIACPCGSITPIRPN